MKLPINNEKERSDRHDQSFPLYKQWRAHLQHIFCSDGAGEEMPPLTGLTVRNFLIKF
jgi:hypothetical protein